MKKEQRFETTDWNPLNVEKIVKENPDKKEELLNGEFRFQGQTFIEDLGPDD